MDPIDDYYAVLGVPSNSNPNDLKRRYRFLSHAFHPDKFATQDQRKTAEEEFKRINQAYRTLSDPVLRARFDSQCARPAQATRPSPFSEGTPHKSRADFRSTHPCGTCSPATPILGAGALVLFYGGIGLSAFGVVTNTGGLNGSGALICLMGWVIRMLCR